MDNLRETLRPSCLVGNDRTFNSKRISLWKDRSLFVEKLLWQRRRLFLLNLVSGSYPGYAAKSPIKQCFLDFMCISTTKFLSKHRLQFSRCCKTQDSAFLRSSREMLHHTLKAFFKTIDLIFRNFHTEGLLGQASVCVF